MQRIHALSSGARPHMPSTTACRGLQGVALAPLALPFALLHVALLLVLSALLAPSVLAQMAYQLLRYVNACQCCDRDYYGSPCLFFCSLMRSTGYTAVGQSLIFMEGLAGLVAVVVSLGFPAPQAFFKRCFTAWLVPVWQRQCDVTDRRRYVHYKQQNHHPTRRP